MTEVRYFKEDESFTGDFALARSGYFLQFGIRNETTMAIVRDKQTGACVMTWPDFIRFVEHPSDVLRDKIIESMKLFVSTKKHEEMEVEVISLFNKYGLR